MLFSKQNKKKYRFLLFVMAVVLVCVNFRKTTASAATSLIGLKADFDKKTPAKQVAVTVSYSAESLQKLEYVPLRIANITYFSKYPDNCTAIKKNADGVYSFVAKANGYYSIHAIDNLGNDEFITIQIKNVDNEAPQLTIRAVPFGSSGKICFVTVTAKDNASESVSIKYVEDSHPSITDDAWKNAIELVSGKEVRLATGKYSFLATDAVGNSTILVKGIGISEPTPTPTPRPAREKEDEFRAVWIAYYDFKTTGYTEQEFREHVIEMFTNVANMNMNAVVVHVRPFSDAMYPSKYFPWSRYCSGTQGKNPGFDPLEIMVTEAHKLGLEFHAWLNPYRVSNTTTDVTTLSKDHPARIYRTDNNKANDRNVLTYSGKLYYNPASAEVQKLIVNGIKEIVENYDVDGIHFDDYFYPSLGKNYTTNFDAPEYEAYKKKQIAANKSYLSIADWRRENVNNLVRTIYSTIKEVNPEVVFGISPGGFMDALRADDKYYVDFDTWVSHDGYIDYLCPQLYWSNDHSIYPYNEILKRFSDAMVNPEVKLYIGVGAYKAGIKTEGNDWQKNPNVLRNMIIEGRKLDNVDGFVLFDYSHIMSKKNYTSIKNMMKEFQ